MLRPEEIRAAKVALRDIKRELKSIKVRPQYKDKWYKFKAF